MKTAITILLMFIAAPAFAQQPFAFQVDSIIEVSADATDKKLRFASEADTILEDWQAGIYKEPSATPLVSNTYAPNARMAAIVYVAYDPVIDDYVITHALADTLITWCDVWTLIGKEGCVWEDWEKDVRKKHDARNKAMARKER